jgi:hypothetical protein
VVYELDGGSSLVELPPFIPSMMYLDQRASMRLEGSRRGISLLLKGRTMRTPLDCSTEHGAPLIPESLGFPRAEQLQSLIFGSCKPVTARAAIDFRPVHEMRMSLIRG